MFYASLGSHTLVQHVNFITRHQKLTEIDTAGCQCQNGARGVQKIWWFLLSGVNLCARPEPNSGWSEIFNVMGSISNMFKRYSHVQKYPKNIFRGRFDTENFFMTFLIPLQFQCFSHSQTAIFQMCESCATGLIVTKTNQWLSGLRKNWKQGIWCVDIYLLFFIVSQDWKIAWSKILIVESRDWLCHWSFLSSLKLFWALTEILSTWTNIWSIKKNFSHANSEGQLFDVTNVSKRSCLPLSQLWWVPDMYKNFFSRWLITFNWWVLLVKNWPKVWQKINRKAVESLSFPFLESRNAIGKVALLVGSSLKMTHGCPNSTRIEINFCMVLSSFDCFFPMLPELKNELILVKVWKLWAHGFVLLMSVVVSEFFLVLTQIFSCWAESLCVKTNFQPCRKCQNQFWEATNDCKRFKSFLGTFKLVSFPQVQTLQ